MEALNENYQEPVPRPTLITIMCILTLVGSSIGIVSDVISLFSIQIGSVVLPYPIWIPALGLLFGFGKIAAAILLLRMRKIGFFIYAPMEVGVACLTMLMGKIQMDYMDESFVNQTLPFDPSILTIVTTGLWVILSITFLIVYATQLNKMT